MGNGKWDMGPGSIRFGDGVFAFTLMKQHGSA